jgi:hypothetical protein
MPGSALSPDPDKYAAYCNELRLIGLLKTLRPIAVQGEEPT